MMGIFLPCSGLAERARRGVYSAGRPGRNIEAGQTRTKMLHTITLVILTNTSYLLLNNPRAA